MHQGGDLSYLSFSRAIYYYFYDFFAKRSWIKPFVWSRLAAFSPEWKMYYAFEYDFFFFFIDMVSHVFTSCSVSCLLPLKYHNCLLSGGNILCGCRNFWYLRSTDGINKFEIWNLNFTPSRTLIHNIRVNIFESSISFFYYKRFKNSSRIILFLFLFFVFISIKRVQQTV